MGKLSNDSVEEFVQILQLIKEKCKKFLIIEHIHEVNPDYILTVTYEDYYLLIQPTGQAPTRFYVESQTKFFSVDPYIEIRFLKGDDGNVDRLLLTQRGHTSTARKIQ